MSYIKIVPNYIGLQILENIAHKSIDNVFFPSGKLKCELLEAYHEHLPDKKKLPQKFQHPAADTFVIYRQINNDFHGSREIYRFKGRIRRKKLNKIITKFPNASVLVDLGNGLTKMIPIKIFKQLIQIKFIIFERDYEFCMPDEYEHESMNAIWGSLPGRLKDYIYSINQLIYTLTIENSYNKAIENFMLAKFYLLVGEEKNLKILYHDGKPEKIKLEDFLDKYNINTSVDFL
jgi:hypothetical protein